MTDYQRTRHELPADVKEQYDKVTKTMTRAELTETRRAYAHTLRATGWTLQSVADLFDVSREMVRQMAEKADTANARSVVDSHALLVPELPIKPVKAKREYVEPSAETLARLLELQPMAQAVRSFSPRFRAEAEEYTSLLNHAHTVEGVTLYRLAKRLGVTHGALRFRLARYGYKQPVNGTSRVYQAVIAENRVH